MSSFELAIRIMLSLTFTAAVIGKVRTADARRSFVTSVGSTGLLPRRLSPAVAGGVVLTELALAVLLPLPQTSIPALAGAVMLLAAFSVVVATALRTGRRVACRCFGGNGSAIGVPHLVRNGALLVLAVAGFAVALTGPGIRSQDAFVAVPFGVVGAFLAVTFVDFATLFRRSVPEIRTEPGR
ncbi:MauE/DoxX family redox-associated membrane protein [Spirillospora sp. NPDC127200]